MDSIVRRVAETALHITAWMARHGVCGLASASASSSCGSARGHRLVQHRHGGAHRPIASRIVYGLALETLSIARA